MANYNKILQKIYEEKDASTNISLFLGSVFSIIPYTLTHDFLLVAIIFISVFSLSKFISSILINKINTSKLSKASIEAYSEKELETIDVFIKNGTCLIPLSKVNKGIIEINESGLHSLVSRGIIDFVDNSMGDGPSGFKLNESVYRSFLARNN